MSISIRADCSGAALAHTISLKMRLNFPEIEKRFEAAEKSLQSHGKITRKKAQKSAINHEIQNIPKQEQIPKPAVRILFA